MNTQLNAYSEKSPRQNLFKVGRQGETYRSSSRNREETSEPLPSAKTVEMYPLLRSKSHFVLKLTKLIEAHIDDETYDIHCLCRDAGASRTQIHHKLKKWTGLSTSHFIRSIKLKRAQFLLLNSDLNISQIAYEVGFENSQYFSRVFHRSFGMPPKDFRKRELSR